MQPEEGRVRVVIEGVMPEIDSGRYPIKRIVGEEVVVEADIVADGHDALSCVLLYRQQATAEWTEVPMEPLVNDRWQGSLRVQELGRYRYTLNPETVPTHIFVLRRRVRTEHDFDYYM